MEKPVYDHIGKTYDNTRQADPIIAQKLRELLCPIKNGRYLDIGCGSGNYAGALAAMQLEVEGVDLSLEMLEKARNKYSHILFHQGDARQLDFEDDTFDGAICVLAMHHIGNLLKGCQQAYRVIKQGCFVIFTTTPEQMQNYWLCHYFPQMMRDAAASMTSFDELRTTLKQVGFQTIKKYPFFISNELKDWFLHAGKYRPEIYLNEKVRAGISSFHLFSQATELEEGLKQLEMDINSKEIHKVIEHYESSEGDYLFIAAEKNL